MANGELRCRSTAPRPSGVRGVGSTSLLFGMITRLLVHGMTCQRCVQAIFTALTPVAGIISADVRIGVATIEHDGRATADALRSAIAVSGYDVTHVKEERRHLPIR
jgi:copper chaperone CopZ